MRVNRLLLFLFLTMWPALQGVASKSCDQLSTGLQKYLKGSVKSVVSEVYGIRFGEFSKEVSTEKKKFFNLEGRLISEERKSFPPSPYDVVKKYHYDYKGRILSTTETDDKNSLKKYSDYAYKSEKRITTYSEYNGDGLLKFKIENVRDRGGNVIRSKTLNNATINYGDGEKILNSHYSESSYSYKFDSDGRVIEKRSDHKTNRGISTSTRSYEYDSRGHCIGISQLNDERELVRKNTIRYNSLGYPEETRIQNSKGELLSSYSSEYRYDHKNNWIEETIFENGKKASFTKRKIEYYQE